MQLGENSIVDMQIRGEHVGIAILGDNVVQNTTSTPVIAFKLAGTDASGNPQYSTITDMSDAADNMSFALGGRIVMLKNADGFYQRTNPSLNILSDVTLLNDIESGAKNLTQLNAYSPQGVQDLTITEDSIPSTIGTVTFDVAGNYIFPDGSIAFSDGTFLGSSNNETLFTAGTVVAQIDDYMQFVGYYELTKDFSYNHVVTTVFKKIFANADTDISTTTAPFTGHVIAHVVSFGGTGTSSSFGGSGAMIVGTRAVTAGQEISMQNINIGGSGTTSVNIGTAANNYLTVTSGNGANGGTVQTAGTAWSNIVSIPGNKGNSVAPGASVYGDPLDPDNPSYGKGGAKNGGVGYPPYIRLEFMSI